MSLYSAKRKLRRFVKKIVYSSKLLKEMNYRRIWMSNSKARNTLLSNGVRVAKHAIVVLEEGGFEPVLAFGTLLGAVREGGIIEHDIDLDIGMQMDSNEDWKRAEALLKESGFRKVREFGFEGLTTEQSYESEGMVFDIFGFMPIVGSSERRSFFYCLLDDVDYEHEDDRSVKFIDFPCIKSRELIPVGESRLPIPSDAEEWLTRAYTEHWRVPDPTWQSGTGGGWKTVEGAIVRRRTFE